MQYLTNICQAWLSFLSQATQVQSARSLPDHVGGDSSFCILFESAAALQGKPLFILHPDKSRRSLQFTLLQSYPSRRCLQHETPMLIVQDLVKKTTKWHKQETGARGHYNFKPGIIVMKFGEQLRSSVIKEYQWYYIAYDELKAQLNTEYESPPTKAHPKPKRKEWTEEREREFINRLEEELEKVHTKQKVKAIEIGRRIASAEKEVSDVVGRLDSRPPAHANGIQQNDDAPTEEEFMMLEEDLSDIIADVHDLAKFVQLNYTGFQKIIKKHDVGDQLLLLDVANNGRNKHSGCSSQYSQRG
jgi:hypothetical protein